MKFCNGLFYILKTNNKIVKQNPDEVLETIHNIIEAHADSIEHLGVLSGLSGTTLFQFYYAEYIKDKSITNKAIDSIGQCIEKNQFGICAPYVLHGHSRFDMDIESFGAGRIH